MNMIDQDLHELNTLLQAGGEYPKKETQPELSAEQVQQVCWPASNLKNLGVVCKQKEAGYAPYTHRMSDEELAPPSLSSRPWWSEASSPVGRPSEGAPAHSKQPQPLQVMARALKAVHEAQLGSPGGKSAPK